MTAEQGSRHGASTHRTRHAVGLGLAAIVVIVAVALVAWFGIVQYPDLATLRDQPEPVPPGRLVYQAQTGDRTCIRVAEADGTIRDLRCEDDRRGGMVRWSADATAVLVERYEGQAVVVEHLDPETGEVLERRIQPDTARPQPHGPPPDGHAPTLITEDGGGTATLRLLTPAGDDRVLWQVDGPQGYHFRETRWSQDRAWVLVRDSRDHWIVLQSQGDPQPRVWVRDVWDVDWSAALALR